MHCIIIIILVVRVIQDRMSCAIILHVGAYLTIIYFCRVRVVNGNGALVTTGNLDNYHVIITVFALPLRTYK